MYLVTGASGNVGSEIVNQLLARGEGVRVLTRDPAHVGQFAKTTEVVVGDFQRRDAIVKAVAGVDGIFVMNRGLDASALSGLIAAALATGRPRVTFLSTLMAGVPQSDIGALHRSQEEAIERSGLPAKFIRPGGFMSNVWQWLLGIIAEGVVHNPMGDGKFAPIAPEDIAAVAVRALTDPTLDHDILELTGGELITVPEQVATLENLMGRPLRCVEITVESAIEGMIRTGLPAQVAKAVGQSYESVRSGQGVQLRDTFERVTGRKPMTFAAWAQKHAARFPRDLAETAG